MAARPAHHAVRDDPHHEAHLSSRLMLRVYTATVTSPLVPILLVNQNNLREHAFLCQTFDDRSSVFLTLADGKLIGTHTDEGFNDMSLFITFLPPKNIHHILSSRFSVDMRTCMNTVSDRVM